MIHETEINRRFDERLDLRLPRFLDETGEDGADAARARRLNDILCDVFVYTETALPKIIAQVRTDLGLMPAEFADAARMTEKIYVTTEQDPGPNVHQQRERYSEVLAAWRTQSVSEGIREQYLELLRPAATLDAFYHRMGYELGHKTMTNILPSIWTTLPQRLRTPEGKPPTVPDLLEVLSHIDQCYPPTESAADIERRQRRLEEGERIWTNEMTNTLQIRTLEQPLIQLLIGMEKDGAREHSKTISVRTMQELYDLRSTTAFHLARAELVPWEEIESVARKLFPDVSTLESEWKAAWGAECARSNFAGVFHEIRGKTGMSMNDLGELLDAQSTGMKRGDRRDQAVNMVVNDNVNSAQVPVAVLIRLIAQDEADESALSRAYALERKRHYQRSGSWLSGKGLKMRIDRELAGEGVSIDPLAKRVQEAVTPKGDLNEIKRHLGRLERQEGTEHPISFRTVDGVLKEILDEKITAALARRDAKDKATEALKQWSTVRNLAAAAIKLIGSAAQVSDRMRAVAEHDGLWIRASLITDMAEGEYVPPLPALKALAKCAGGKNLPPEVTADWFDSYPAHLHSQAKIAHPLARVLLTAIGAVESRSSRKFYDERFTAGTPNQASMLLHRLGKDGSLPPRSHVEATMLAAGHDRESIPYALALALFDHGTIGDAIKAIQPLLEESTLDVTPENLIGLSKDELAPYVTAPVFSHQA